MNIKVKKLTPTATVPSKAYRYDAGFDLYADEALQIYPGQRKVISTSIAMEIPEGYVGLIWPRSGLAVKRGVDVLAGVIDSSYRGEIKVCLLNTNIELSLDVVDITPGDKIAQILIQKIADCELEEVEELSGSDRGEKGFGSSG